jgi:ubiquitin-activating enzyme E1 C
MLIGTDGVYSYTFEHEKRDDCPVCGGESLDISISRDWTVDRLIEMLVEKQDMCVFLMPPCILYNHVFDSARNSQIKKPSLSSPTQQIYFQAPPQLEEATRPNLEKRVSDLVESGGEITVTASSLPFSLSLRINYV